MLIWVKENFSYLATYTSQISCFHRDNCFTQSVAIYCAPAQQPSKIIISSNKIPFCLMKCLNFKRDKFNEFSATDMVVSIRLLIRWNLTFWITFASYIGSMKSLLQSYCFGWILTRTIEAWVFMVFILVAIDPSWYLALSLRY